MRSCAAEPQLSALGENEACLRIHQTAGRLTARWPFFQQCFSAAAAMESYSRAYPHLVKLHMLQEIADVAGEGGSHSRECWLNASGNAEEVCPPAGVCSLTFAVHADLLSLTFTSFCWPPRPVPASCRLPAAAAGTAGAAASAALGGAAEGDPILSGQPGGWVLGGQARVVKEGRP